MKSPSVSKMASLPENEYPPGKLEFALLAVKSSSEMLRERANSRTLKILIILTTSHTLYHLSKVYSRKNEFWKILNMIFFISISLDLIIIFTGIQLPKAFWWKFRLVNYSGVLTVFIACFIWYSKNLVESIGGIFAVSPFAWPWNVACKNLLKNKSLKFWYRKPKWTLFLVLDKDPPCLISRKSNLTFKLMIN